jgi:peptidoglycan hydrolase-like protein with peptidoglycan-binding domain
MKIGNIAIAGTCFAVMTVQPLLADELTLMVEQDLDRLGYETGPVDGEETMETVIAISKFQSEANLPVTGSVTPELARALMMQKQTPTAGAASATAAETAAPTQAQDPAALHAAQQACLQEKVAAAQASQKKKRGLGSLIRAVTRNVGFDSGTTKTMNEVYNANATAEDLTAAARDLGLTEDEVAACQNPG